MKHTVHFNHSRQGSVMMTVMVLFGILSIMSMTVFIVASTDVLVTGQYRNLQHSFYDAEAGLQHLKASMETDLKSGALVFDSAVETVNYTTPAGFNWDPVQQLTRMSNTNWYMVTITGRTQNAETVIEAVVGRKNLLASLGVYGDTLSRTQPNSEIYSYRSDHIINPLPANSTSEAGVGSNEEIILQTGAMVDGAVLLGQDNGVPASHSLPLGTVVHDLGREIEADPLGIQGGDLAWNVSWYSNAANNDNASAIPPIVNNKISGNTVLPPGNYYLEDLVIGSGETLTIGGTPDDPVVIYFKGDQSNDEIRFQPNSNLVFSPGEKKPTAFRIYAAGDHDIRIQPNLDFYGMIYAPFADIQIQPNNNFYGAVWGHEVLIQPGGLIWIDMDLVDQYQATSLEYKSWKMVKAY